MISHSPLRYPGGKGKLSPYVGALLDLNMDGQGHYAEPFAGGAAIALDLLFSERVKHIHINDIDPCIYAFWHSAVYDTDKFMRLIRDTPVNLDNWKLAKVRYSRPTEFSTLEVGFATFFMNRTNRSGILNAGVIGGNAQLGDWKIDCRFNKNDLLQRIHRIGLYRSRISVTGEDANIFVSQTLAKIGKDLLIYLDPPYYVKGAYLYQNHFKHEDHVRLAATINQFKHLKWIVSYDNVPEIKEIYRDYEQEEFGITYSARNYGQGKEVMVFADGIVRPSKIFTSEKKFQPIARQQRYIAASEVVAD